MNILITGVSSGLGKELSLKLLSSGQTVLGFSRKSIDSVELRELIINKNFIYNECDIAKDNDVSRFVRNIKEQNFPIDVVILNASLMQNDMINKEFDYIKFKEIVDVNLFGVVKIISYLLPLFQQRGKGVFIGISSLASQRGIVVNKIAYPVSKAALNMAFEAFRLQLANSNIRFMTVNLGPLYEKGGILSVSYKQAARKIVSLINKEKNVLNYPLITSFIFRMFRYFPDSFISRYIIRTSK